MLNTYGETRTVLTNTLGINENGVGDYGLPHLRNEGRNGEVRRFQRNDDGTETFLGIQEPGKPAVRKVPFQPRKRRRD